MVIGLALCLGIGMAVTLGGRLNRITPAEAVRWSWRRARNHCAIGLVSWLSCGLGIGLVTEADQLAADAVLVFILGVALGGGITSGLVGGLSSDQLLTRTIPNEGIRQSLRNALISLLITLGLSVILGSGLIFGLIFGLDNEDTLIFKLVSGLTVGLGGGLAFGLISGLGNGSAFGLVRSSAIWAVVALVCMLMVELINQVAWVHQMGNQGIGVGVGVGVGVGAGLVFGLTGGLVGGLQNGGSAYLKHYVLRFLMWCNDCAPLNYIRFLDYAAERIFLRKVGGGYIFTHRFLMEYFATLEPIKQTKAK